MEDTEIIQSYLIISPFEIETNHERIEYSIKSRLHGLTKPVVVGSVQIYNGLNNHISDIERFHAFMLPSGGMTARHLRVFQVNDYLIYYLSISSSFHRLVEAYRVENELHFTTEGFAEEVSNFVGVFQDGCGSCEAVLLPRCNELDIFVGLSWLTHTKARKQWNFSAVYISGLTNRVTSIVNRVMVECYSDCGSSTNSVNRKTINRYLEFVLCNTDIALFVLLLSTCPGPMRSKTILKLWLSDKIVPNGYLKDRHYHFLGGRSPVSSFRVHSVRRQIYRLSEHNG
ncbi:hypothetical protein CLF_104426 [Clonorchis sinensis]|uniref:Uncharacterized protein n=1 Tax=Clonorchis sinensis TaxID=79923 RepID=G7YBN1_CLOSI|nr:hypothetical protein CLF_104426 [Clonorchis sinensis]